MPRRIAYLCGMTYLDYDQTMTQDFAQRVSPLRLSRTVISFTLTFCNCCLVPISISSVLSSFNISRSSIIQFLKSCMRSLVLPLHIRTECQIQLCVICVAVYTWEVLADDIKQLTGVDRKQKRPETTPLKNSLSEWKRR